MSRPSRPGDGPEAARNLCGTELKRLHRDWRRRTEQRLGLLLDGVQNPFNVGAILRTAAAFSVDHLWLVVQRHLGADSLATWMEGEGWATERLVSRAGYRLLQVSAR